jgi:hypothetical protein
MFRYLPLAITIALLVVFRIVGTVFPNDLPNFQPLVALFFCGALLAPSWWAFGIPLLIWAVTYPFGIGPIHDLSIFVTTLGALGITALIGKFFSTRNTASLMLGSVSAALVFHLITSIAAWLGDPLYGKTLTGFWQSFWVGPASSVIPSWVFLRNLVAANVLFTGVFVLATLRQAPTPIGQPLLSK